MPRAGTTQCKRERLGLPPVKPGRRSWVHSSKVAFFETHKEDYLAAAEINETGLFYSKVAHLYLGKYGYNTGWTEDLDKDQEMVSDVDEDEDVDSLAPEEAAARLEYFKLLRTKIGAWYNTTYGGSVERKPATVTFKTLFDKTELEPPAPTKPLRFAVLSRLPNPPKPVTVRNTVTRERWLAETPAFRAEVEASLEREHEAAKKAYTVATSGETPSTPEEYDVTLNNVVYYLQPFVDAARERYRMNVTLLLCGPIPGRGGQIEMHSVHAGTTNGLVPRIWSDFDRGGFAAAQKSFVRFTEECFTQDECQARALAGATAGPSTTPTMQDQAGAAGVQSTDPGPVTPISVPPIPTSTMSSTPVGAQSAEPGLVIPMSVAPISTSRTSSTLRATPQPITAASGTSANEDLGNGILDLLGNPPLSDMDDEWWRLHVEDYDRMMPSDLWLGSIPTEPNIGQALGAELARLSESEQAEEMRKLQLFFMRLARGIETLVALDLSLDPEDNGDGGEEEGLGAVAKRTRGPGSPKGRTPGGERRPKPQAMWRGAPHTLNEGTTALPQPVGVAPDQSNDQTMTPRGNEQSGTSAPSNNSITPSPPASDAPNGAQPPNDSSAGGTTILPGDGQNDSIAGGTPMPRTAKRSRP
ncbi:hypothetical protein K438DRAFT_1997401 [Mycena galopus ATCC 62051]|nr:hypothetical protein K438DRAFT_1997401 [Mycena galopus ATCC 62051]